MRNLLVIVLVLFATVGAAVADPVTIEAKMILASNDPAPLDRRLERVDYQLRRILRFETFRLLGEGSAMVNLPGTTRIDLGSGSHVEIQASGGKDDRVRAQVVWIKDGATMVNTTVSMKREAVVILGGIPHDRGTLIVTLNTR